MSMPVRDVNLGGIQAEVERRADGTQIVRSNQPLPKYPDKLTARLDHWATVTPKRTFIAQRGPDGDWRQLTYEDARDRARGIGQALIDRGLGFLICSTSQMRPTDIAHDAQEVEAYADIFSLLGGEVERPPLGQPMPRAADGHSWWSKNTGGQANSLKR